MSVSRRTRHKPADIVVHMTAITVHAIPSDDLEQIRRSGRDVAGNRPEPWPDPAGMPLRCCLRRATADDEIVLIAHAPLQDPSPWREVGPVFVHAQRCPGYNEGSGLPPELRTGPRVLRSYRHNGSLYYDAIRPVAAGTDIEGALKELLDDPDVREVHVRSLAAQCFHYAVRPVR